MNEVRTDYPFGVPKPAEIREVYNTVVDTWRTRNKFIDDVREMLAGLNTIDSPTGTSYKIRTVHTHMLGAIANEKLSRYSHLPNIQTIPSIPIDGDQNEAREISDRVENATRIAMFEMERSGEGDSWGKVIHDAIMLDMGVEKIERAPAAFWPEMFQEDDDGNPAHPFEDADAIDNYKRGQGFPIRATYVPLERFLPVFEGSTAVETFEVEQRSLRSILRNSLFKSGHDKMGMWSTGTDGGLSTMVTIIHYCNQTHYAYFALSPGSSSDAWPGLDSSIVGEPILLHSYEHGLGKVLYNIVDGRFGGWRTDSNKIENIIRAMMELNQRADEVMSQALTNIRATHWPTMVLTVDAEKRGSTVGNTPKPPSVKEGQHIVLFKGEDLRRTIEDVGDPQVQWIIEQFEERINTLGGSSALFGGRAPGVETGFHQNLQITQAEHLDEKLEQHIAFGAAQRATLMYSHIKRMDIDGGPGKVWVNRIEEGKEGKTASYLSISAKDLTPMPIIDAQVRKPRPVDLTASLRVAMQASDDRNGKGPLISDAAIRSEILGRQDLTGDERQILVEGQKRTLLIEGVIGARVTELVGLKLLKANTPELAEGDLDGADPALTSSIGGGDTPRNPGAELPSGQTPGQNQPEAQDGFAVSQAIASA